MVRRCRCTDEEIQNVAMVRTTPRQPKGRAAAAVHGSDVAVAADLLRHAAAAVVVVAGEAAAALLPLPLSLPVILLAEGEDPPSPPENSPNISASCILLSRSGSSLLPSPVFVSGCVPTFAFFRFCCRS